MNVSRVVRKTWLYLLFFHFFRSCSPHKSPSVPMTLERFVFTLQVSLVLDSCFETRSFRDNSLLSEALGPMISASDGQGFSKQESTRANKAAISQRKRVIMRSQVLNTPTSSEGRFFSTPKRIITWDWGKTDDRNLNYCKPLLLPQNPRSSKPTIVDGTLRFLQAAISRSIESKSRSDRLDQECSSMIIHD